MDKNHDQNLLTAAEALACTRRLRAIRRLCGYVQDGSAQTVKIFEDDATRTFHIKVNNRSWWGNSFEEVLDKMDAEVGDEHG